MTTFWHRSIDSLGRDTLRSILCSVRADISLAVLDAFGAPAPDAAEEARARIGARGGNEYAMNVRIDPASASEWEDFITYAPYSAHAAIRCTGSDHDVIEIVDAEGVIVSDAVLRVLNDSQGWERVSPDRSILAFLRATTRRWRRS